MLNRLIRLIGFELHKLYRQKFAYILVGFVIFNAAMFGIGARVFPRIISAFGSGGGGGPRFDGYTFATIISASSFSSLGAAMIAMLAFSGSVIATETDSGTLKNILTRPLKRYEFVLAKAAMLFFYCLVVTIVMSCIGLFAGWMMYGLGDIAIVETGEVYRTSGEMLFNYAISCGLDLLSVYAVACLGMLFSVVVDHAAWAVITPLVVYPPIVFLKNFEIFEPYMFTTYMGAGHNVLREMAVVKSRTWFPDLWHFLAVDILTIAVLLGITVFVFSRKEIN
jgi:ABC-2 type transport system permease protein